MFASCWYSRARNKGVAPLLNGSFTSCAFLSYLDLCELLPKCGQHMALTISSEMTEFVSCRATIEQQRSCKVSNCSHASSSSFVSFVFCFVGLFKRRRSDEPNRTSAAAGAGDRCRTLKESLKEYQAIFSFSFYLQPTQDWFTVPQKHRSEVLYLSSLLSNCAIHEVKCIELKMFLPSL